MKKILITLLFIIAITSVFSENIDVSNINTINITNKSGDISFVFDKSDKMWVTGYNTQNLPLSITAVNGVMNIVTDPGEKNIPTLLNITFPKNSNLSNVNIISENGRVTIENFPSDITLNVRSHIGTTAYYGALNNLHVSARGGIFYNGKVMIDKVSNTWDSGSGALKIIKNDRDDVWITKPLN